MSRFTDQKQRVATEHEAEVVSWGGRGPGSLRCYLCGDKIYAGEPWRWVYSSGRTFEANGKKRGVMNITTCGGCDGPDVLDRWVAANKELATRFWWAG